MGDAAIRSVVNLACAPPFECRAALASRIEADELAEQIADTLALRVHREDAELAIQVIEPLELVTCAREVTRLGGSLRAFGATPGSLDLLVDATESWQWLCAALDLEPREDQRPFVATLEGGYLELDELVEGYTFLERPVLAITKLPRPAPNRREPPEIFDCDDVEKGALVFERDARGWYVREVSTSPRWRLDDAFMEGQHRLTIGDRLMTYGWGYEVVAIL